MKVVASLATCLTIVIPVQLRAQCDNQWFPHRQILVKYRQLAAIDLNGRGSLELVGRTYDNNALTVATFDDGLYPSITTIVEESGGAMTPADFDQDGDTDLLIYRLSTSELQVLRNDNGILIDGPSIPAPNGVSCALDYDGDGDLDIAMFGADTVHIYFNDGAANLSTGPMVEVAGGGGEIKPARLNADDRPDLIAVSNRRIIPILQTADGGLEALPEFTDDFGDAADVDGDGFTDILVDHLHLYLGNGDGTFDRTPYIFPEHEESLHLVDLASDGYPEIITNSKHKGLRVIRNDAGVFSEQPLPVGAEDATKVISTDFDGDGNLDLIAVRDLGTDIWLGKGDTTFFNQDAFLLFREGHTVLPSDFDRDGDTDIIAIGRYASLRSALAALSNDGNGVFTQVAYVPLPPFTVRHSPTLADFDNDGDLDIAVQNQYQLTLLEYTSESPFTIMRALPSDVSFSSYNLRLPAVDLNNDGLLDIVVTDVVEDWGISIHINNGGWDFTTSFQPISSIETMLLAAADFDLDGNVDIITGDGSGISLRTGLGDGTFSDPAPYILDASIRSYLYPTDFNNDQAIDLLIENEGVFHICLNDGTGGFTVASTHGVHSEARNIGIADINHDGLLDVAIADSLSNKASIYLGDGQGQFAPPHPVLHRSGTPTRHTDRRPQR